MDTQYETEAELKLDDLPEGLRTVCEGRTVVKVHPVGAEESGTYFANPLPKSSVGSIM